MFPRLEINCNGIIENAKKIIELCRNNGVEPSLVVKALGGNAKIVSRLVDLGIESICDSRVSNIKAFCEYGINCRKILIREPMVCEVDDVIKYCDVSVNSEIFTVKELEKSATEQNKTHKIIIMAETGDRREGLFKDGIIDLIDFVKNNCPHIIIEGIGTNTGDYGSVIPTVEGMTEFIETVCEIQRETGISFKTVSGGSSDILPLLLDKTLPKGINQVRIGEGFLLGNIPCFEVPVPGCNTRNFILKAQIVELQEKPSLPYGKRASFDGLGNAAKEITDRGITKRALIALGRQEVDFEHLTPKDSNCIILGGSSDYTIIDVNDCENDYKVGDILEFYVGYTALLRSMTSPSIEKIIY